MLAAQPADARCRVTHITTRQRWRKRFGSAGSTCAAQLASEADKPPFAAIGAEAPRALQVARRRAPCSGKRRAASPPACEGGLSAYWQIRWADEMAQSRSVGADS